MDAPTKNLGGRERAKDDRDLLLGAAQAPAEIPTTFLPDNSWLVRNYQGQTPFCGEHAGTHLKAILDYYASNGTAIERKNPRYGAIKLKDPKSPVYDGFSIDAGTDMRAIFQWLQRVGADDFEPLENDVTLAWPTYCDRSVITPTMDKNAATSVIANYAFGNTDFESLCQLAYAKKAVLILLKCDEGMWGTATPTFTQPLYGHFVVMDGYSEDAIRVIDSAEPNDALAVKMISKQYITSVFFFESGTAIDPAQAQAIKSAIVSDSAAVVQDVAQDPQITVPEKQTILEEIEEIVESIV